MKLQKRINRRVGDKEYLKYYVDIPANEIDKLDWINGQDLDFEVKGDKIILKPKKERHV